MCQSLLSTTLSLISFTPGYESTTLMSLVPAPVSSDGKQRCREVSTCPRSGAHQAEPSLRAQVCAVACSLLLAWPPTQTHSGSPRERPPYSSLSGVTVRRHGVEAESLTFTFMRRSGSPVCLLLDKQHWGERGSGSHAVQTPGRHPWARGSENTNGFSFCVVMK